MFESNSAGWTARLLTFDWGSAYLRMAFLVGLGAFFFKDEVPSSSEAALLTSPSELLDAAGCISASVAGWGAVLRFLGAAFAAGLLTAACSEGAGARASGAPAPTAGTDWTGVWCAGEPAG